MTLLFMNIFYSGKSVCYRVDLDLVWKVTEINVELIWETDVEDIPVEFWKEPGIP